MENLYPQGLCSVNPLYKGIDNDLGVVWIEVDWRGMKGIEDFVPSEPLHQCLAPDQTENQGWTAQLKTIFKYNCSRQSSFTL